MSAVQRLLEQAAASAHDRVIITPEKTWQCSDLLSAIEAFGEFLRPYQGQVVALWADNSAEWVAIDLAAKQMGVTLIPIPLFFSYQQINHALAESGATAIISDQADIDTLNVSVIEVMPFCLGLTLHAIAKPNGETLIPPTTSKITFTSGSTGQPKGVCLSETNQWRVSEALVDRIAIEQPRHLCVLPFSTLLENVAGVYAPLLAKGELIILDSKSLGFNGANQVDVAQLCAQISHYQPETMIVLPALLKGLVLAVKQGWSVPNSLKFIAAGGAHVSPALLTACQQLGLPVYQGYGLSECGSVVCLNSPEQRQMTSVGQPLNHIFLENKDGELHVTGNAFLGYINQPESWGKSTVATGDIAKIEEEGYVRLLGRQRNLLISSYGRNINPEWIESEVLNHPAIAQCMVVGDNKPFCAALITLRDNTISTVDIDKWIDLVNQYLPPYAQLNAWQCIAEPFSVEANTLTQNGRLKREQIYMNYQSQINDIYRETA